MPKAEFGIIYRIDTEKDYSEYEPEKYDCIAIDDDYLDDWWPKLALMKTYYHSMNRPGAALARWGVTLIPPQSLDCFYNVVDSDIPSKQDESLEKLLELIIKAKKTNKFIIHFGI